MCGIAGILKFDPAHFVNAIQLRGMRDALTHRGPDDAGIMVQGRVGLAHRRLSIIDLTGGHQPMGNGDRSIWITYNGELYNYRELRMQLQAAGYVFQTGSDTEVILAAYEIHGRDCVNYLRGMFAFCIWDSKRQTLFMARDRLGIKPLYYSLKSDELLFGSEIKAIISADDKVDFNRAILPEFLASRYVSGEETFFSGIKKLPPAHTASWTPQGGLLINRYWRLPPTQHNAQMTHADYVQLVREGVRDAVQSHLVSDVPVGLFLSGGLDSTILGALMAEMRDEPVNTFSVGFKEQSANELHYARVAAKAMGSRHREITVAPEQFFTALPHLVWHEDEPIAFTSSVPLHFVSMLAKDHIKVVLTGEGADELFLGYDFRYRATVWNKRLGDIYSSLCPSRLRGSIAELVPNLPGPLRRYVERSFLKLGTDPRQMFFENFSLFNHGQRAGLLAGTNSAGHHDPYAESLQAYNLAGNDPLQSMSHADMQTYLVELLMKQDQMSMSASLESRVPFLDHELVEKVASIPGNQKLRFWQTKALLRESMGDIIPKQILHRKKMGFPVPTGGWLRDRFWPIVEEFVLSPRALDRGYFNAEYLQILAMQHRRGKANHGDRLWLLINFEMWQRIFVDGQHPSSVYEGKVKSLQLTQSGVPQQAALRYS